MIWLFIISLFLTLLITRIFAHLFHDMKNYRKKKEKSKTLTGWLRKKTGFDLHHIHFGFILLFGTIISIIFTGLTNILIIFLAIALSLIIDQIFPLLNYGNYFSKKMIIASLILHILIVIIAILVNRINL